MKTPFRPLKRFGQNFLTDKNVVARIMQAASVGPDECVLEIGPGAGALTEVLAVKAKRVVVVEIDKGLCRALKEEMAGRPQVDVVCSDILKFDLPAYLKKKRIRKVKVVANLPYYITTPIVEYLFKHIDRVQDIYITVQKEVAERMSAAVRTKAYGSFTCFVNYFCRPSVLFKIKRDSFRPVPKVDSCFVRLEPYGKAERPWRVFSEEVLFRVIRAAFGQRRKQLLNSLASVFDKQDLQKTLSPGFQSRRAEELTLEDFASLANGLSKL